jgi:hypothetical protein
MSPSEARQLNGIDVDTVGIAASDVALMTVVISEHNSYSPQATAIWHGIRRISAQNY